MKLTAMFILGIFAGIIGTIALIPKSENVKPEAIAVELSIGGDVRVLKADPNNSIHVITNDDLVLTDIQLLPHNVRTESVPFIKSKSHGQPPSQIISSSSQ